MSGRVDLRILGFVAAGGAAGVLARAALTAPVDDPVAAAAMTFLINAVGSLLLGVVVGCLSPRSARIRAFLGTGLLGGFTTYSAFALQVTTWLATPWLAGALMFVSLLAGVTGAAAGLFIGRRLTDRPGRLEPRESAE